MNETETGHVFPLPEAEKRKLEGVEEEILHPAATRFHRYLRTNTWSMVAFGLATGLICGLVWGRRH
jgi:ElaB/YqjD/DUF883 family membrane-anchored ribosome-binding protein